MLLEALQYLTTPCPQPFRRMGYLKELIATEARGRRCRDAWQPHLDRTRQLIADAVQATGGREKAVILGGGMLADIPLGVLAAAFERVVLVDVCFLKKTRRTVWRHPHIELVTADLAGTAEAIARGEIPAVPAPAGPSLADADLVVSANVLSQLPLIPMQVLRRRTPSPGEDTLSALAGEIIAAHLDYLKTCPGTACLITEVERRSVAGDRVIHTEDPLFGVDPGIEGEEWLWEMAPKGEVSPDYAIRNRVRGMVVSKHAGT